MSESNEKLKKEDDKDIIYSPVKKLDIYSRRRQRVTLLAHTLKRLSHEGSMEMFEKLLVAIANKQNKMLKLKIRDQMKIADLRLIAIDAEIEAKRLKYDTSLGNSDIFEKMEKLIPLTSDPVHSSIMYLARYGSALSMKNTVEAGLACLAYAKQHSEMVQPCKETGMVYYIETNLFCQLYERTPTEDLKEKVLSTTKTSIAQFQNEPDDIRKDYERMLLLKMAFCHLGLNLFGKRIENAILVSDDKKLAKGCLDFIERPDIWERMESRRKMLYYIAKAEFYRQEKNMDLCLLNAREAKKYALRNDWTAELPNIKYMLNEVKQCVFGQTKNL